MTITTNALQLPENQRHLLANWDRLTATQQEMLSQQIRAIDFDLIEEISGEYIDAVDWSALANRAEPPEAFRLGESNQYSLESAMQKGHEALSNGEIAVLLVAGGQGSRLGFEHPKGMYSIGPLSKRTLFQFHIDQLIALGKRFGKPIPLYLMTSPATHDETVAYFEENNWFSLAEENIRIFCQGTMPAVHKDTGKMLLAATDRVFLSPDGHGGALDALERNGCLNEFEARDIKHLFYLQVDNPLVDMCCPALIGYHLLASSEMTTQVVAKQSPTDKVGNVVMVDGTMSIIEYSDLPDQCATRVDHNGRSIFWAGNIAVHVFSVEFLQKSAASPNSLPYHRALKHVAHVDDDGRMVSSGEKNAIKFEKFIFDLMPLAKNPIVVEADASEVFAPLKNASGDVKDTPETTQEAILAKCRRMLDAAGVRVEPEIKVEINPSFASGADELTEKLVGKSITTDSYLI